MKTYKIDICVDCDCIVAETYEYLHSEHEVITYDMVKVSNPNKWERAEAEFMSSIQAHFPPDHTHYRRD